MRQYAARLVLVAFAAAALAGDERPPADGVAGGFVLPPDLLVPRAWHRGDAVTLLAGAGAPDAGTRPA